MPVKTFDDLPGASSAGGFSEIQVGVTSSVRFPPYGGDPAAFSGTVKVTATRDSDGVEVLSLVKAKDNNEGTSVSQAHLR